MTNPELTEDLQLRQLGTNAAASITILDAITESRKRLASNVRDLLVLESLCTLMILRRDLAA
jgi:DNA polymerase-3 subunit delta'